LSLKQLRHLNPGYLQDRVPFRKKGYDLILPLASCEQLKKSLGDTLRMTVPIHKKVQQQTRGTVLAANFYSNGHPMMLLHQIPRWIWHWDFA
jgi:hypothetical protein